MFKFSIASLGKLRQCHLDLQKIMREVIKEVDITIITGYRSPEEQNLKFKQGLSNAKAGKSKHNKYPSLAVDIAPYPVDFNDIERFKAVAKIVKDKADMLGIEILWGGSFKTFQGDYGHFELKGVKYEPEIS